MSKNKTTKTAGKKTTAKKAVSKKTSAAKKPAIATKSTSTKPTPTSAVNRNIISSKNYKNLVVGAIVLIAVLLFVQFGVKVEDKSGSKEEEVKVKLDSSKAVSTIGDVEEVVANWIENNPELILESVINMQKKQAEQQAQEAGKNVASRLKDLYNRKDDPQIAPAGSDVAIVEFFDYNCGYCKKSLPLIEQLAKDDPKLKIVFKELPILGKSSEDLAKVSLAFNMIAPSKYFAFHQDLMKSSSRTTDDAIKIAQKHGVTDVSIKKVLAKFADKIQEEIDFNRELSASIGVNGTPAFLVGEVLIPGATSVDNMKAKIKEQRAK